MPSASDTFANYIRNVRRYLAEVKPEKSRWEQDFLKQLFNSCYRRRINQLVMAFEGAFEYEVSMPAITSSTLYTNIYEAFEQLTSFTALNAQSTLSLDTTLKTQGLSSLNLDKAAGNATVGFTKTFPGSFSVSTAYQDKLYFQYYALDNTLLTASGLRLRLGHDASNYFEYQKDPTALTASSWNTITIDLLVPTSTTGTPNLSNISYLEINLVFSAAGTVQTGYKFDKLYIQEKPADISYYPWPTGFERLIRLEAETTDGRRIPLSRDNRAVRSFSPNDAAFLGGSPTYRPVAGGFVLEPPFSSTSSIANVVLGYNGTTPLLVNDNEQLHPDFPASFDELIVLDTALAAMDSESLLEGGGVRSLLRLRSEWELDYERYIDNRITAMRRIELADSYYEDA